MYTEEQIIQIFELIVDCKPEKALSLAAGAEEIIEPKLRSFSRRCRTEHGINGRALTTVGDAFPAYLVGIVTGIYLAKRPDILGNFAKAVGETVSLEHKVRAMLRRAKFRTVQGGQANQEVEL